MLDDLLQLDTEVTIALAGLDARTTQFAPKAQVGKRNIQEIAEHLQSSVDATIDAVQAQVRKGSALKSRPDAGQRIGRWLVLSAGWLPAVKKAPRAATQSRPATLKTGDQLSDRLHLRLVEFDRLGLATRKSIGAGPVAEHSWLGPLSIRQWSRFHLVHGQHHLRQIARIRQDWGF